MIQPERDHDDRRAFVTGSHAYGTPHADSDIDLVVFVSMKDSKRLEQSNQSELRTGLDEAYISAGGTPYRFGRLNLIVVSDPKMYDVWRQGTRELKRKAPVTRDFAIEHFRRLRKKAGFSVGSGLVGDNVDEIPF